MLLEQTLYIVATPIGNRDDLSARAIDVLRHVDRIYAEDTRHSLPLLRHHGIDTRVLALHEHNEEALLSSVLDYLHSGGSAALISDAGTPLINDPGFRLVRACRQAKIRVSPVPGACAVTAALSVSGLATERFQFLGYAPHKRAARLAWLRPLESAGHTQVIYESPHRIVECLSDIVEVFGEAREMCLARELTKRFETVLTGSCSEILANVVSDSNQQKGEFVLIIGGRVQQEQQNSDVNPELDRTLLVLLDYLPVKTAAKAAAELFEINKRAAYDRALVLKGK